MTLFRQRWLRSTSLAVLALAPLAAFVCILLCAPAHPAAVPAAEAHAAAPAPCHEGTQGSAAVRGSITHDCAANHGAAPGSTAAQRQTGVAPAPAPPVQGPYAHLVRAVESPGVSPPGPPASALALRPPLVLRI